MEREMIPLSRFVFVGILALLGLVASSTLTERPVAAQNSDQCSAPLRSWEHPLTGEPFHLNGRSLVEVIAHDEGITFWEFTELRPEYSDVNSFYPREGAAYIRVNEVANTCSPADLANMAADIAKLTKGTTEWRRTYTAYWSKWIDIVGLMRSIHPAPFPPDVALPVVACSWAGGDKHALPGETIEADPGGMWRIVLPTHPVQVAYGTHTGTLSYTGADPNTASTLAHWTRILWCDPAGIASAMFHDAFWGNQIVRNSRMIVDGHELFFPFLSAMPMEERSEPPPSGPTLVARP